MAQFDVHRNRGALRDAIPFVVVVQSALFDRYQRRVVVPLVKTSALPAGTPTVGSRMSPVFDVDGHQLVLHPLGIVSVACDQLGDAAGSLKHEGLTIADALDELLTRAWQ